MKASATVRIDAAYFDTAEGEQFFDKYTEWKNGNAVSEDIKRRREKIAAAGLTSGGNKLDDLKGYIKRVFDGIEEESLMLSDVTAAVNALAKQDGKDGRTTNSGVSLSLRKHCTDFVTVEGKGKTTKATRKNDETPTAGSGTPTKKKKAAATATA